MELMLQLPDSSADYLSNLFVWSVTCHRIVKHADADLGYNDIKFTVEASVL